MKPIEKAANSAMSNNAYGMTVAKITITAFLDAVLADPEAMQRIAYGICHGEGDYAEAAIKALKQEASR